MAPTFQKLRQDAIKAGVAASVVRSASSVEELQEILNDHQAHGDSDNGESGKRAVKKGGTKMAVKKKATAKKKGTAKRSEAKQPTRKPTTRKNTARKPAANSNGDMKRHTLDGVNFKGDHEGWNPRPGSAPDRIIRALAKANGNREKVFDRLLPDIWDFMSKRKRDGSKRTKEEAHDMLRYRISRTAWQFAVQTGQHETAGGRQEYGTGGTGQGIYKRAKASSRNGSGKRSTAKARVKATKSTKKTAAKKSAKKKTARR